jgi:hypothetical protein
VRVEAAERGLEEDPTVQAGIAGLEAAQAREGADVLVDEVELRLRESHTDRNEVRVTARVPIKRPSELRAQREVRRAETEVALSRLEEISLERRTELCFPSVEAIAYEERVALFEDYAARQRELLRWNKEWRAAGTINELSAASFELEGRVRLAAWEPPPAATTHRIHARLPSIEKRSTTLAADPGWMRETVRNHHPSVGVRRATARRYAALAVRERARQQPWIRFVDLTYEERTRDARDGYGGRLAFEIPFGASERADVTRYEALERQQKGEGEAVIQLQLAHGLHALEEIRGFEARSEQWLDLERLATGALEIADRWRRRRAARPNQVAQLLDEAFEARTTVLDARERAALAECTLLATTGIPIENWSRVSSVIAPDKD